MLTCNICPHYCQLEDNEIGKCLVRQNKDDCIINLMEGKCSLLAYEPIEKRPFFHYRPGTYYFSAGFYGCSLSCSFCYNYKVSQSGSGSHLYKNPIELAGMVRSRINCAGIAFTFNEPTVHYEYILKVAQSLSSEFDVVLKTNGFVDPSILDQLSSACAAFNVDIKGDESEYERVCGGTMSHVMTSVEQLCSSHRHTEISYLVLPRLVRDFSHHRRMRDWLANLSVDIPVHLLYFYPFHKMTDETYEVYELLPIIDFFRERMRHVYISNCYDRSVVRYRNTFCVKCGDLMVDRERGIRVLKTSCCNRSILG